MSQKKKKNTTDQESSLESPEIHPYMQRSPFDNGDTLSNRERLFDKWCGEVVFDMKKSKTGLYSK